MRALMMSTLLLVLLAGGCLGNDYVLKLELRSAAEIGPQATPAKGPAGEPAIEVAGGAGRSTTTLLVADHPGFCNYMLRGRVKYHDVAGGGYLEMLNDFGDKGTFFTRSLSVPGGPLSKLSGTSDWRDFELPFYAWQDGLLPKRVTLNVVLPGAGTVTVAEPLAIVGLAPPGPWWTERQAGIVGGGLGSFLGLLGAMMGIAAGWGKSRTLTLTFCGLGLATCAISTIIGLVALCAGQPWHVSVPLLYMGIFMLVFGGMLPMIHRRYQADEFRRMTAADVG